MYVGDGTDDSVAPLYRQSNQSDSVGKQLNDNE